MSVVSGIVSAVAADDAADTQADAQMSAAQLQIDAAERASKLQAENALKAADVQVKAADEAAQEQKRAIIEVARMRAQGANDAAIAKAQAQADAATKYAETAKAQAAEVMQAAQQQAASITQATQTATGRVEEGLQRGLAYQQPYIEAGTNALATLQEKINAGPGEYEQSPGYQFRLSEGQKAIDRQASMQGNVMSGAAVKGQTRFAEDYATNDYDNFLARYYASLSPFQQMASVGQAAATSSANMETNAADTIASFVYNGGIRSAAALAEGQKDAAGITAAGAYDEINANLNAVNIREQGRFDGNEIHAAYTTKLADTEAQRIKDIGSYKAAGLTGATNALAGGIMSAGNAAATGTANAGDAQAAGSINQANAITGAMQSGTNNALMAYNLWKKYGAAAETAGAVENAIFNTTAADYMFLA